jgi:predicted transcriptional regulator
VGELATSMSPTRDIISVVKLKSGFVYAETNSHHKQSIMRNSELEVADISYYLALQAGVGPTGSIDTTRKGGELPLGNLPDHSLFCRAHPTRRSRVRQEVVIIIKSLQMSDRQPSTR